MPFSLAATVLTAAPSPTPAGQPDPASVSAGSLGLIVIVLLLVAVLVLWRSMNTQLRRVDFDESASTDEERVRRRGRDGHRPAGS